ncbi:THO complex subunit 2 [Paramyrothecium foliicola]|nr:THO complex subunit 2 [Paramyrothecium foliicola]
MPAKRKRNGPPSADGGRPSPHRPADTQLGQHDRDDGGGRGRGRPPRGPNRRDSHGYGRGNPNHNPNHSPTPRRSNSFTSQPPVVPPQQQPQQQPQSQPQPYQQQQQSTLPPPPPPPAKPTPSAESVAKPQATPTRSNYRYDNLTDEKISSWADRGRAEIITHGVQSREDVDITELSSLFQEFVHAVVENRLDARDAGACVKEILGDETSETIKDAYAYAPHSIFADSFAIVMENDPALYKPSLRDFLMATGVSTSLLRQVLDIPILGELGLVRETFFRTGVRHSTELLYRQANYNLLREETEGYSKLITELFTTSSFTTPPPEMAEQTFERVKALIGTFDLDVGRALDVTLDVAAAVLIKQYKFFVKLLRVSSWWPRSHRKYASSDTANGLPKWAQPGYSQWTVTEEDESLIIQENLKRDAAFWDRAREVHLAAFFELGGRQVTDSAAQQATQTESEADKDSSTALEHQWIRDTKTLPPPGNRVAAQLLGFKLLFYSSKGRDEADILPANLLYLAALLIKIGFLSLPDLYPHLYPADDAMEQVREKQAKEIEEQERSSRGGPMNALLMAGVLPQGDDDNPIAPGMPRKELAKKAEPEPKQAATDESASKSNLKEPLEQKVSLLIQLLTIGAIPESLFILGRFPWIPELYPEVLIRIHRILHHMLEKVYGDSRPTASRPSECPTKNMPDIDQNGMPKGSVRLGRLATKKVWRWPFPDKADTNENQTYRFYWDEWNDNIPVCQTVDDVFTLCNTFLNLSGVNIGKDEALLAKLASIGKRSLAEDQSSANLTRWHDLLRRLLVPALSHTKANASVVNAIWALLKHYPTATRYSIYAEWFEGQISRLPAMKGAFARATSETRGTMKRVSLTNLNEMAKQLAKTSYSSPGIVFRVAFEQLESYPNLIEAFVECAKYFTDLSYDVLVWSLLSSLGKSRSRTQAEHALTTSKWLQALSRFSGKVFRRYPGLDPTPVLQYVNEQLFQNNSTDLIILKEFISSMGGIVDSSDFTDHQILSMAGGECLRRHTLIKGQDKRFENTKSSKRLIQALTDSKLAARFLVNLAQYRQAAIYQVPEDEAHIKYLSAIVDDSHQALIKYLDFLWSNLEPAAFDSIVPSLPELMASYGLDANLAFLIGRASLAHRMYPWKPKKSEEPKEKTQPSQTDADKEGDVTMTDPKVSNEAVGTPARDTLQSEDQVGASQSPAAPPPTNPKPSQRSDDSSSIRAAMQPTVDSVQDKVRPAVWQKIAPELYVIFWALQLGDLFCPDKIYRQEKERLRAEELAISRDRTDMSRKGQERKMEKRRDLVQMQIGLSEECGEHLLRQAKWKFYLTKQFQTSFPNRDANPDSVSDILLEQCFLPRLSLSIADAEYTFKFIKALHDYNAPGFKLMSLYDRLFNANRLRSLIFTCTTREAEYLGRFLKLVLEDLSRWHRNDPVFNEKDSKPSKDQPRLGAYEKEGKGPSDQPKLGFVLTFDEDGKPETFVEHAQFKDILFRWHKNLNMALKSCLAGTEWMHIRNAITVLRSVLDFFPAIDFMGNQFMTQLQKITKQEAASKTAVETEEAHRVDLSVAAQGALSELQKRKAKWVLVQAFRPNAVSSIIFDKQMRPHANISIGRWLQNGIRKADTKPPCHGRGVQTAQQVCSLFVLFSTFQLMPVRTSDKQSLPEEEDGEVNDGKDGKSQSNASQGQAPATPKDSLPAKPSTQGRHDSASSSGPARSSTPKPNQTNANSSRGDPRPMSLPDRPPHTLPSRPDVPIPGHPFTSERYGQQRGHERRDGRDGRTPRDHRDPRSDNRQMDSDKPPRGHESRTTDSTRDSHRADLPQRQPPVERERPARDASSSRQNDRAAEQNPPSSAPTGPSDAQEPLMNPERAALFAKDEPQTRTHDSDRSRPRRQAPNATLDGINPERAALFRENEDNTPTRPPRDDGRERNPRGHSPRRGGRYGHDQGPPGPYPDERHGRLQPPDPRHVGRNYRDQSPQVGGVHRDRALDHEGERGNMGKPRDASGFPRPSSRDHESDQRAPPYPGPNDGRLDPYPPSNDIPSGPRGRGRGAARGGHPPSQGPGGGRSDGRFAGPDTPRAPSPERAPPTGPSSSGRGRRGYEPSHGPSTPSGAGGGMHPDRLHNFSGPDMSPASANATPLGGGHPSRLSQLSGSLPPTPPPPPPGPMSSNHGRHSMGSMQTPDRPGPSHGPRQSMGSTSNAPGLEGGVPTGPASSNERMRSGGGKRQLAGINNMLQQAQANMPEPTRSSSMRRNQPRQMLGNSDVQVLTGGSPTSTPGHERQDPMRFDPAQPGRGGPSNGDEGMPRPEAERGHRSEHHNRPERSSRSSRRSSRERGDRERSPGRDRESKEHREYRDRRSGGTTEGGANGGSREERESRRSNREGGAREPMGPPASGRDLMGGPRDSRHQGGRTGEDWSGRSGRGGPRQEERRESREDRGRKRRSEEGAGNLQNEREKRPRR